MELDEGMFQLGLKAAAARLPFLPDARRIRHGCVEHQPRNQDGEVPLRRRRGTAGRARACRRMWRYATSTSADVAGQLAHRRPRSVLRRMVLPRGRQGLSHHRGDRADGCVRRSADRAADAHRAQPGALVSRPRSTARTRPPARRPTASMWSICGATVRRRRADGRTTSPNTWRAWASRTMSKPSVEEPGSMPCHCRFSRPAVTGSGCRMNQSAPVHCILIEPGHARTRSPG